MKVNAQEHNKMNRPGRVGRATRGSVRAVGLVTALVAVLAAGCGSTGDAAESGARDDRGELTQLVYRFYDYMEEGRFDDLDAVLSKDVVVSSPGMGVTEGREAVIAGAEEGAKTEDRTQHVVTNVLVDLSGDKAKVRANVEQLFGSSTTPEGKIAPEPTLSISSVMHYEAVRAPEGWRVSRIEGDVLWAVDSAAPGAAAGQ
jgi:ketosteroid isomerase-like protein